MRMIQMPEIRTAERWKRERVVAASTEQEAAELLAAGGVEIHSEDGDASAPKKGRK